MNSEKKLLSRANLVSALAEFLQRDRLKLIEDRPIRDIKFGDLSKDPIEIEILYGEEVEVYPL